MNIKYKVMLMAMFLGVFVLSIASIFYSTLSYNKVEKDVKNSFLKHAIDNSSNVKDNLKEKLFIAKTISTAPILIEGVEKSNSYYNSLSKKERIKKIENLNNRWKKERTTKSDFINSYLINNISKYLKKQQLTFPGIYGEIFLTNRYGAMIATTSVLSTLAHSSKYWWKQAYNKGEGKVFFDDRGFDESVGGYVLGIVVPIKKGKETIGILKVNVNILESLNEVIQKYDSTYKGTIKIVRSKGLVVLEKGKTPLSTRVNNEISNKLLSHGIGNFETKDYIIAYAPVILSKDKSIGFGGKKSRLNDHKKGNENEIWHVVIEVDKKIIAKENEEVNKMIIYVVLLLIVISILFSFFIGAFIGKPIEKLSKIVKRFGNGELDIRANFKLNDEVGFLAKTFDDMAENLEKTMISRDELIEEVQKRKQIELMLINEMKKAYELSIVVENSINEIYIFDKKSLKFIYANKSALKNIGYSLEEMQNKTPMDIKTDITLEYFNKIVEPLFTDGTAYVSFHTTHKRKNGTTYPVKVNLQLIEYKNSLSYVAIIIDMTEEEKMNKKIREKEEIMIAQSRHAAMGEMISMIAHQWRQPLGIIAMGANNIILDVKLDSITDEALLEVAQEILIETDYLSKTIDDFRNFFKPNKDVEKVDIKDIFDEVYKIIGKSFESNSISIIKSFNTNKKIETYSRELIQVFLNILKNAKEALVENTKENRKIEISVYELDDSIKISIKDNAGGIDKSIEDKIFNPYFSTKDEKNGTGLGLYMSKTIIEKHLKGSIKLQNHLTGVIFEIVLPFKIK